MTAITTCYENTIKQQDQTLDDIEKGLDNLTNINLEIANKLSDEERLLTQLHNNIDGVTGQTQTARKKINEVMRKPAYQVTIIIVLLLITGMLAYFVLR